MTSTRGDSPEAALVRMPSPGANDHDVKLARWTVTAGDRVETGALLCEVEGTKAALEVTAEAAGFVYPVRPAGSRPPVGSVLAVILPTPDPERAAAFQSAADSSGGPLVSDKARELMVRHGLSTADFMGFTSIRAEDVEQLMRSKQDDTAETRIAAMTGVDDRSVLIYGSGSLGLVAWDALCADDATRVPAYLDDAPRSTELNGVPVIHSVHAMKLLEAGLRHVHVALPDVQAGLAAEQRLRSIGFDVVSIVHPSAVVASRARLGSNVFLGPLTVVGPEAELGDHVRLFNGASVAHHSRIGRGTKITDGARIGGHVSIGENTLVGLNASVNFHLTVGSDVTIVSGAVVTSSIPDHAIVDRHGKARPK